MTPRTLHVQIELDDTSADADRIAALIERTLSADPFTLDADAKAVSVYVFYDSKGDPNYRP